MQASAVHLDVARNNTSYNMEAIEVARNKAQEEVYATLINNQDIINKVISNIENDVPRLIVPVNIFDEQIPNFSLGLINEPSVYIPAIDTAVQDMYSHVSDNPSGFKHARVGFGGWIRGHTVTPRGLTAKLLNTLVAVEGIVTRCSVAKPKMIRTVHLAEASGRFLTREYADTAALDRSVGSNTLIPNRDPDGHAFCMEVGMSEFKDSQKLVIQEMPENAPTGQLPCSVEVVVEGDLVDKCKAGDRVTVYGVFRAVPRKEQGTLTGSSATFIIGNNVHQLAGNIARLDLVPHDISLMRQISKRRDVLMHMAHSIAPALCGGVDKKKGLLLQLLGGSGKSLEGGTVKVRGDIHILLIGDPSCGKSQMLRFMQNASPLALSTTGRGSSGVGLTAAVTVDKDTGERRLEAGAMVMADRGLVAIDEFDKMSHEDRVAIHEVMEQQQVSISKASIQCTLNARCSVLAAANPAYGCFEDSKDIKSQITFPDSLMSRFDLIFLVHDTQTPSEDRKICRTVIGHHTIKESRALQVSGNQSNGEVDTTNWTVQPRADPSVSVPNYSKSSSDGHVVYSLSFIKKYVQFAKRLSPTLSDEAVDNISDFYTDLRGKSSSHARGAQRFAVPTARTLEACIRLSTAHAKLRLSEVVESVDVFEAKKLLSLTLLGERIEEEEVTVKPKVKAKSKAKAGKKRADENEEENSRKKGRGEVYAIEAQQNSYSNLEYKEVVKFMIEAKERGDTTIDLNTFFDLLGSKVSFNLNSNARDQLLEELAKDNYVMDVGGTLYIV